MKAIRLIAHPYTVITTFLLIIISGRSISSIYALYILLGLTGLAVHAVVAVCGILILIINYQKYRGSERVVLKPIFNLIGALALALSLFLFFYNDKSNYNIGTFYELVPRILMGVFGIVLVTFLIDNISSILKIRHHLIM
jgi:hypothetical protein